MVRSLDAEKQMEMSSQYTSAMMNVYEQYLKKNTVEPQKGAEGFIKIATDTIYNDEDFSIEVKVSGDTHKFMFKKAFINDVRSMRNQREN